MPVVRSQTMGSGEGPKQFSQPSRKGKKSWRKNVDVTDVEHGLKELNEEIIRGYSPPEQIFHSFSLRVLTFYSQRRYPRERLLRTLYYRSKRRREDIESSAQIHQKGPQGRRDSISAISRPFCFLTQETRRENK